MKFLLAIIVCIGLSACSAVSENRKLRIVYEGYELPVGTSIWLENGTNKILIMKDNIHSWEGYFRSGDAFSITEVKNNKRVKYLYNVIINNIDNRTIICDEKISHCRE